VAAGTQITEGRGGPVAPINVPEPVGRIGATKAGAEAVGTMLLATLLSKLRSAELQKAVDRLKELIPDIDQYRKAGNDVIVTMIVEVPNQVDIAALIAGIGTQDQVVYFKRMFISSAVKHYNAPPTYTTMTANLAPGDPEQRDPHEYTLEQQIKLQMGEKYPVPGTEPQKGFHFVSADLPLPAFTAAAEASRPAAPEPGALKGIGGRYSAKFESIFIGSAFLIPFLVNRYLQVDQDSSGKLTPKMWQPGPTLFSYLPYAPHGHIVISGRFALGQGIPPDATWIYSNMEYPREGLILEWVKGLDAGLNTTWDALVSWHKVS
jgi:hypothetical protein